MKTTTNKQLRKLIREEIQRVNEESDRDAFKNYMAGEMTLDELISKVGGNLKKLASKKQIADFLKNSFMIDWMALEKNTDKKTIIKQAKQLMAAL